MERKLAFCVGNWAADSTLFSWTYAKQYFLRKQRDEQGNETLSDLDKLYVVHVNSGKSKEKWDVGGPILPRLSTALANYPHTIIELEGRDTAAAILEFAAREEIDVIILGSREHKGAMQKMVPGVSNLGSTSDNVKARCKCPCLIIRPSSARNEKMRIKSMVNLGQLIDSQGFNPGASLPVNVKASVLLATAPPEPRKVCIAFEHAEPGNNMTAWAVKYCLFPDDYIYLVHVTHKSPLEKMQKSASFQKATLKLKHVDSTLDNENCDHVGVEELQGFEEPIRRRLKGDAKTELCDFLEAESVDLLIVGFSAANRFKKAFAGGSVSSHMLHHAACPVVVLPLKSMAWEEQDAVPEMRHSNSNAAAGMEPQLSSVQEGSEGTSPPPMFSLGPRVSMSRSLSHQLSWSKDQARQYADAASTSPTSIPLSPSSYPPPKSDVIRTSSDGAQQPQSGAPRFLRSPRSSSERFPAPATSPQLTSMPSPTSPFEEQAMQQFPRGSAEGAESLLQPPAAQGLAGRKSSTADRSPVPASSEAAQLRQQLEERDLELAALRDEVRHLKFQIAALKGSGNPARLMLPA